MNHGKLPVCLGMKIPTQGTKCSMMATFLVQLEQRETCAHITTETSEGYRCPGHPCEL